MNLFIAFGCCNGLLARLDSHRELALIPINCHEITCTPVTWHSGVEMKLNSFWWSFILATSRGQVKQLYIEFGAPFERHRGVPPLSQFSLHPCRLISVTFYKTWTVDHTTCCRIHVHIVNKFEIWTSGSWNCAHNTACWIGFKPPHWPWLGVCTLTKVLAIDVARLA